MVVCERDGWLLPLSAKATVAPSNNRYVLGLDACFFFLFFQVLFARRGTINSFVVGERVRAIKSKDHSNRSCVS